MEACSRFTNCYGPAQARLPPTAPPAATTTTQQQQSATLTSWSLKLNIPALRAWPGPVDTGEISAGIDEMVMQLPDRSCSAKQQQKDDDDGATASGRPPDHSGCGYGGAADLTREVVGIYDRFLPAVFEESYRTHMEEQARK